MKDPEAAFPSPRDVVREMTLSADQKRRILEQWHLDAQRLEESAWENMTGGEPSRLGEVTRALSSLQASDARAASRSLVLHVQDALAGEIFAARLCAAWLDGDQPVDHPETTALVKIVHHRSEFHAKRLEALLDALETGNTGVHSAYARGIGMSVASMRRGPDREAVDALREIFVALNYVAASYHIVYAEARREVNPRVAGVALRHLRELTPTIRELSRLLAWLSAGQLDGDTLAQIASDLLEAWSSDLPLEGQDE
ncbi:MAG: hypothetical protein HKP27_10125 [Myxococcales bacterium]|nr:hypothetical protein [Myxococcales bacterium]